MKLLLRNLMVVFGFVCVFLAITAFDSLSKSSEKESVGSVSEEFLRIDFVNDSVVNEVKDPSQVSLFDTSHVFERYWHNTNLFSYSYPKSAAIPDSMYFVMCDSETQFFMPREGGINSPFGPRWGRMHKGLDIHLKRGDAVNAVMSGKVRYAQFNTGGYGNLVIIRHPNGLETYYAHLTDIHVDPNDWVSAGALIGTGGNTGAEWSGEHLHFEMRYRDKAFDPLLIIDWAKKELKSDTLVLLKKHLLLSDEVAQQSTNGKGADAAKVNSVRPRSQSNQNGHVTPSKSTCHIVKLGDSVYSIARKYGKSAARILSINGLTTESVLNIGQKIRLD